MDNVTALAHAYANAWASREPLAIADLHTEDSVFHLHDILEPHVGRDRIAAFAAATVADSPDLTFDPIRVRLGADHFVSEYVMRGTLAGQSFACHGADIFTVRANRVARKDSYIDWLTFVAQTGIDPNERGARFVLST